MSIGLLVTARLKSTRLPKKVNKPILGRPMICHMLDRLKLAKRPQKIIICTSILEQDDPLVEIANQEGVDYFRGHPDDVLLRLTTAAEDFEIDTVVNCTADNPFVDYIYIDRLVDFHLENNHDYSGVEGLPWGAFAYVVSYAAMLHACEIKNATDTEVWGGYFTETGEFSCGVLEVVDPRVCWPDLRLTVDTPEDFELISKIFDELYEPGQIFPLKEIISLCRRRPDLVAINEHIRQKSGLPIKLKSIIRGAKDELFC